MWYFGIIGEDKNNETYIKNYQVLLQEEEEILVEF